MVKRRKSSGMKRGMRGGAWYNDLWDGIKSAAGTVNDLAKKTKIISTIANASGRPEIGTVASQLGYGRGRFKVPRKGVILV